MFFNLLIGWGLLGVCVCIHAAALTFAMRWLRAKDLTVGSFWRGNWLFIRLAGWIVLVHLLEIGVWGLLYFFSRGMPDMHSAFYFSSVTYTTTGYGDLVLPKEWRLLGGIEALTGVLMCGWSTGFFFAVVSRMYDARQKE